MKQFEDKLENYFEIEDYFGMLRKYNLKFESEELEPENSEETIYNLIVKLRTVERGKHFRTIQEFFEDVDNQIDEKLDRKVELPF